MDAIRKKYLVKSNFLVMPEASGAARLVKAGMALWALEPLTDPVQFEIDNARHYVDRAVFNANTERV